MICAASPQRSAGTSQCTSFEGRCCGCWRLVPVGLCATTRSPATCSASHQPGKDAGGDCPNRLVGAGEQRRASYHHAATVTGFHRLRLLAPAAVGVLALERDLEVWADEVDLLLCWSARTSPCRFAPTRSGREAIRLVPVRGRSAAGSAARCPGRGRPGCGGGRVVRRAGPRSTACVARRCGAVRRGRGDSAMPERRVPDPRCDWWSPGGRAGPRPGRCARR